MKGGTDKLVMEFMIKMNVFISNDEVNKTILVFLDKDNFLS